MVSCQAETSPSVIMALGRGRYSTGGDLVPEGGSSDYKLQVPEYFTFIRVTYLR